jgi:hypothetical protein
VEGGHDNVSNPYGGLWRESYKPVAREFSVWIAGVSNVGPINDGPWAGRKCIGCSLVVGPQGNEAAVGPYGIDAEKLLYVEVETTDRPGPLGSWRKHWQGGRAD